MTRPNRTSSTCKAWGNRMAKYAMAAAAENCGREYGRRKSGRHTPMVGQQRYRPRSISPAAHAVKIAIWVSAKKMEKDRRKGILQLNRTPRVSPNSTHAHQR